MNEKNEGLKLLSSAGEIIHPGDLMSINQDVERPVYGLERPIYGVESAMYVGSGGYRDETYINVFYEGHLQKFGYPARYGRWRIKKL